MNDLLEHRLYKNIKKEIENKAKNQGWQTVVRDATLHYLTNTPTKQTSENLVFILACLVRRKYFTENQLLEYLKMLGIVS